LGRPGLEFAIRCAPAPLRPVGRSVGGSLAFEHLEERWMMTVPTVVSILRATPLATERLSGNELWKNKGFVATAFGFKNNSCRN
jgi:hypothetical protein